MSARTLERWCDEWEYQEFINSARLAKVSKPASSRITDSKRCRSEEPRWKSALRVTGSTRDDALQVILIRPKVSDE
jgi:hypothetical protein